MISRDWGGILLIYYITLFLMIGLTFGLSAYLMWKGTYKEKSQYGIRFKRNRFRDIKSTIEVQFNDKETDSLFKDAGIKGSSAAYQIMRYTIIVIWLIIILYNKFYLGSFSRYSFALLIIVFIITSPRKEFLGRKSPFYSVMGLLQYKYKNRKNKEIYRALSQLKNLSIISSEISLGSDYILEEIYKFTKITKPIFSMFLSMWYEADRLTACEYFANAIGTKEGREISNLFLKRDDLNPGELKHQIELYQEMVKSERQTYKEKFNEARGNVLYSMVMFSAIVVLLNFVIVVITVDALNFYRSIFN